MGHGEPWPTIKTAKSNITFHNNITLSSLLYRSYLRSGLDFTSLQVPYHERWSYKVVAPVWYPPSSRKKKSCWTPLLRVMV